MKRRIFNAIAVLSAVMCAGTVGLWARGHCDLWRLSHAGLINDSRIPATDWSSIDVWSFEHTQMGFGVLRQRNAADDPIGFSFHHEGVPDGPTPLWTFVCEHEPGYLNLAIGVPHLVVFLLSAILPVVQMTGMYRRRRRARLGLCAKCGYDLRATPERCPECGTIPAASASQSS